MTVFRSQNDSPFQHCLLCLNEAGCLQASLVCLVSVACFLVWNSKKSILPSTWTLIIRLPSVIMGPVGWTLLLPWKQLQLYSAHLSPSYSFWFFFFFKTHMFGMVEVSVCLTVFFFFTFLFGTLVTLSSPCWHGTCNPPPPTSGVLRLQAPVWSALSI